MQYAAAELLTVAITTGKVSVFVYRVALDAGMRFTECSSIVDTLFNFRPEIVIKAKSEYTSHMTLRGCVA